VLRGGNCWAQGREARHKLTVERLRRQVLELQDKAREMREEIRWSGLGWGGVAWGVRDGVGWSVGDQSGDVWSAYVKYAGDGVMLIAACVT
jgi:hypothetical protein